MAPWGASGNIWSLAFCSGCYTGEMSQGHVPRPPHSALSALLLPCHGGNSGMLANSLGVPFPEAQVFFALRSPDCSGIFVITSPGWHMGRKGLCQGSGPFLRELRAFNSMSSTNPRNLHLVWEWAQMDTTEHTFFQNYGLWYKRMWISKAQLLKTQSLGFWIPQSYYFFQEYHKPIQICKSQELTFCFLCSVSQRQYT